MLVVSNPYSSTFYGGRFTPKESVFLKRFGPDTLGAKANYPFRYTSATCDGDSNIGFSKIHDQYKATLSEKEANLHNILKGYDGYAALKPWIKPMAESLHTIVGAEMSLGALSHEFKESLASVLNRMGFAGGTGEGGESNQMKTIDGKPVVDAEAQVASGRWGVTNEYLHKPIIVLKISQGAKPGKGGKVPWYKITVQIQNVRGVDQVTLESPATNKDIQSIEELNSFVEKVRRNNPEAVLRAKIASGEGIEGIAEGLVKAEFDEIEIAGHEGSTGTSTESDIFHTGESKESGLKRVDSHLRIKGWRDRIKLIVAGGVQSPLEAYKLICIGAERLEIGTFLMVAMGCVMLRKCNESRVLTRNEFIDAFLRNLKIQDASNKIQDVLTDLWIELLRQKILVSDAGIVNADFEERDLSEAALSKFENRFKELLTKLSNVTNCDEGDLAMKVLTVIESAKGACKPGIATPDKTLRENFKAKRKEAEAALEQNLAFFLCEMVKLAHGSGFSSLRDAVGSAYRALEPCRGASPAVRYLLEPTETIHIPRPAGPGYLEAARERSVDNQVIRYLEANPHISNTVIVEADTDNLDIGIGGGLGGYSVEHPFQHPIHVRINGEPGQAFGFLTPYGVTLELFGNASDHVAGSLDGGNLIIHGGVGKDFGYGATSGNVYIRDHARSHPSYRNTGATFVIGGDTGDRACQFMTGGETWFLGNVESTDFAEGMTGGLAFIDIEKNPVLNEKYTLRTLTPAQRRRAKEVLMNYATFFEDRLGVNKNDFVASKLRNIRVFNPKSFDKQIISEVMERPKAKWLTWKLGSKQTFGYALGRHKFHAPVSILSEGAPIDDYGSFASSKITMIHSDSIGSQCGKFLEGGRIIAVGDAGDYFGKEAASGLLIALSNVGKLAFHENRGVSALVHNVGSNAFSGMRAGCIVVLGELSDSPETLGNEFYGGHVFINTTANKGLERHSKVSALKGEEEALLRQKIEETISTLTQEKEALEKVVQKELKKAEKAFDQVERKDEWMAFARKKMDSKYGRVIKEISSKIENIGLLLNDLTVFVSLNVADRPKTNRALPAPSVLKEIEDQLPAGPRIFKTNKDGSPDTWNGRVVAALQEVKTTEYYGLIEKQKSGTPLGQMRLVAPKQRILFFGLGAGAIRTASTLFRECPDVEAWMLGKDILGNVDTGVAHWHPAARNRALLQKDVAALNNAKIYGNVWISPEQLRMLAPFFSAVVIANGAVPNEPTIGGSKIPGYDLGCHGGEVSRAYNEAERTSTEPVFPDTFSLEHQWSVVQGGGNVAGDVAQYILKQGKSVIIVVRRNPQGIQMTPAQIEEFFKIKEEKQELVIQTICDSDLDAAELEKSKAGQILAKIRVNSGLEQFMADYDDKPACLFLFTSSVTSVEKTDSGLNIVLNKTEVVDGRVNITDQATKIPVGNYVKCLGNTPNPAYENAIPEGVIVHKAGWTGTRGRGLVAEVFKSAEAVAKEIINTKTQDRLPFRPSVKWDVERVLRQSAEDPNRILNREDYVWLWENNKSLNSPDVWTSLQADRSRRVSDADHTNQALSPMVPGDMQKPIPDVFNVERAYVFFSSKKGNDIAVKVTVSADHKITEMTEEELTEGSKATSTALETPNTFEGDISKLYPYHLLRGLGWFDPTTCDGEGTCFECHINHAPVKEVAPKRGLIEYDNAPSVLQKLFAQDDGVVEKAGENGIIEASVLSCKLDFQHLPPGAYRSKDMAMDAKTCNIKAENLF